MKICKSKVVRLRLLHDMSFFFFNIGIFFTLKFADSFFFEYNLSRSSKLDKSFLHLGNIYTLGGIKAFLMKRLRV